jgi:hypothetical protein
MTVLRTNAAREEEAKAKEMSDGAEIMEMRLYLKEGKILWVEPIDQKELHASKSTGNEYTVDIVPNLSEEGIREVSPVAFQQNSPGCAYWYVIETKNGIVKICLKRT